MYHIVAAFVVVYWMHNKNIVDTLSKQVYHHRHFGEGRDGIQDLILVLEEFSRVTPILNGVDPYVLEKKLEKEWKKITMGKTKPYLFTCLKLIDLREKILLKIKLI